MSYNERNFLGRLELEMLDTTGKAVRITGEHLTCEGGAREATRSLFRPERARFLHGTDFAETLRRAQATLRPSQEARIVLKRYRTGAVIWCARIRWDFWLACKSLFRELAYAPG